ncbi:mucin-binding protein [Ligilactobacillus saerimneri]|uniref:mucin-binding protein n=1 Tax=Ligilactobacillus saerimneri TaxID=228229 RepID=UPI001C1120F4|nr:LPXTG cell wall anchor domain-containing protein [Ligilactobacillus saerimneri]MBU5310364.1 LPXTG cell wall anchor domain-containing protein [Ligilactobacillus saerimneri]
MKALQIKGGGILTDNSTNHGEENSTASAADDTEKTTVANVDNDTIKVSTSNIVGNTVEKTAHPEVTKTNFQVNSSPVINNNNKKGGVLAKQNHPQATASQYQPKESDERKEESSGSSEATYSYYKILREVTIVKPDGQEEVLPYQVLGSIYFNSDESENNQLPKLGFEAIKVSPIAGYNPPVIPAISISIAEFIAEYLNDEITDVTYDGQPIQRQSVHVEPFPVGPKYDDDYDRFYEEFCEEYKDKYDLRDVDFDVLLIKEKYFYTKKEDPKPIEGKEEKTITRTINVHLPNGEVQTTKQPVTLERTYTSVAGSDEKEYGPWNTGQWDAFSAPKLDGYTALPASVDAAKVTSDSLDAVVDIYYRADDPAVVSGKEEKTITRTINVHLPNGEVQTTKQPVTLERTYTSVAGSDKKEYGPWNTGQWDAFSAPKLDGYTALPASVDAAKVTSDSLDAVVDIYYRADDPAVVSGKEEKTITRTINVHLPNGEVQTTKQPVTLERTYTSVAGSDKKEYGPWNTGQWDAFSAPKLDGYTALPASVDAAKVTSDSLDAVVDIYYRANEPVLPETPTIPIDPTKPINPPTTPGKPIEPPTNPITPGNATIGSESGIISNKVATNSKVTSQNVDNKNAQEKLPQTGDKEITIYSILGLILTSFLGAWSFIRKR